MQPRTEGDQARGQHEADRSPRALPDPTARDGEREEQRKPGEDRNAADPRQHAPTEKLLEVELPRGPIGPSILDGTPLGRARLGDARPLRLGDARPLRLGHALPHHDRRPIQRRRLDAQHSPLELLGSTLHCLQPLLRDHPAPPVRLLVDRWLAGNLASS
ncbi:MAG TPA: hypothetical protein VK510_18200 [Solirubrobacteraceae bacterium]|nr:hypothetical protein [Solirubrobacteraceae bacterium]